MKAGYCVCPIFRYHDGLVVFVVPGLEVVAQLELYELSVAHIAVPGVVPVQANHVNKLNLCRNNQN